MYIVVVCHGFRAYISSKALNFQPLAQLPLGNRRWMEVYSVYKQVLANTTINGFFQAVLFALVFLASLLRHTTLQ